jgi:hypothetical protein
MHLGREARVMSRLSFHRLVDDKFQNFDVFVDNPLLDVDEGLEVDRGEF